MRVKRFGATALAAAGAAVVLFGGALPVFAQPGESVPDEGSRPLGETTDDAPVTNPETADGPLAEAIDEASIEVAQLAQERESAEEEWLLRVERLEAAEAAWLEAGAELETAQRRLEEAAGEAYAELSGEPDTELPDLTGLTPLGGDWDLPELTSDVEEAETAESVAHATYDAAELSSSRSEERFTALDDAYQEAQTELDELIEENQEEIEELEQAREEAAQEYSDDFSSEVEGWDAAPEAKKAVEYALLQLGKPYEWGAEGPDTFDCSGLTQSAYAYAGVSLPRVAADQFNFTRDKPVDTEHLLPGDLLFWWDSPGDWTSVYHMGMYVGEGKMVQAPRTGDVVKISGIWFDNFAGAHRVVDAVKTGEGDDDATGDPGGDGGEPSPSPSPSDEPSRPVEPSPTPSPDPSPTPSPTPIDPSPTEPSPDSPTPTEDDSTDSPTPPEDDPSESPTPTEDDSPESPSPSDTGTLSGLLGRQPGTGEASS